MHSWETLERNVKQYAQYIWDRHASAERIAGVNFDCVIGLSPIEKVIIEVTENRSLEKIRSDIAKIQTIRVKMMCENIMIRGFIVCDFELTPGMKDAGAENHITVISFSDFQKMFFNFPTYHHIRSNKRFGSAVDPITGENDSAAYTPVGYELSNGTEIDAEEIAKKIIENKKIILLGDYGTGKSRCFREVFNILSKHSESTLLYPIAIDLKETWGLENSVEIIRRHFSHLGINEDDTNSIIKAYNGKRICFLLDGFDELGSRPWSEDKKTLENLRRHALQGVKDLLSKTGAGFLISGREHYFNSNKEMFLALGINEENAIVAKCKNEFNYQEFTSYLELNGINVELPSWLPKKPLILKTIASLDAHEITSLFSSSNGDEIKFWFKFIDSMCSRDAKIHPILDPETVKQVLVKLASITRTKGQNVGPIIESEVVNAFHDVTGTYPNEQSTVMLQRLPGLGRVSSETSDRNFVDNFILDGLRALDIANRIHSNDKKLSDLKWVNPLKELGVSVLANEIKTNNSANLFITYIKQSIHRDKANKISISDAISAINEIGVHSVDFESINFNEPHFGYINFEGGNISNIMFQYGIFESITLGKIDPKNVFIKDCHIDKLIGVSSGRGVPEWVDNCDVNSYESIDTLTAIKKSGLTAPQTILVSILIKVYRQAGNGRLEHTLTKGLTHVDKKSVGKIIRYLIQRNFLETSKDNGEYIYKPVRKMQGVVDKILVELDRSDEDLWKFVSNLTE
ncbi:hypothetical protein ACB042_14600 [Aeromonas sp. S13(2024)]|uniref:hypothetical protein n=1 Tax=Aeromonas sp. S13(2024) TaxID=3242886 RepID=UPI0035272EBF